MPDIPPEALALIRQLLAGGGGETTAGPSAAIPGASRPEDPLAAAARGMSKGANDYATTPLQALQSGIKGFGDAMQQQRAFQQEEERNKMLAQLLRGGGAPPAAPTSPPATASLTPGGPGQRFGPAAPTMTPAAPAGAPADAGWFAGLRNYFGFGA